MSNNRLLLTSLTWCGWGKRLNFTLEKTFYLATFTGICNKCTATSGERAPRHRGSMQPIWQHECDGLPNSRGLLPTCPGHRQSNFVPRMTPLATDHACYATLYLSALLARPPNVCIFRAPSILSIKTCVRCEMSFTWSTFGGRVRTMPTT